MFNVAGLSLLPLFFTYGTMSTFSLFKYNPDCQFTIQNPLKRPHFLGEKYQNDNLASFHPDSEVFIWEMASGSVGCTIKVSKGHSEQTYPGRPLSRPFTWRHCQMHLTWTQDKKDWTVAQKSRSQNLEHQWRIHSRSSVAMGSTGVRSGHL